MTFQLGFRLERKIKIDSYQNIEINNSVEQFSTNPQNLLKNIFPKMVKSTVTEGAVDVSLVCVYYSYDSLLLSPFHILSNHFTLNQDYQRKIYIKKLLVVGVSRVWSLQLSDRVFC